MRQAMVNVSRENYGRTICLVLWCSQELIASLVILAEHVISHVSGADS